MSDSDINARYRPAPRPDEVADEWIFPSDDWERPESVTAPNRYVGTVRTMTSPLAATLDRDVTGYPVTNHGGSFAVRGFPVDYSPASGGTTEHSLSDHLVSLGAHETRVRRSRKGRTTFDVLAYGKAGAPITDERTGLAGLDAIALARLADSILAATEGERHVSPQGHVTYGRADVSGDGAPWLLGSTVTAWAQLIRDDRAARDAFGVCDHHADLYSALGVPDVADRPLVMRRDRNVTGHVALAHRPIVRSATYGDAITRRTGSGESQMTWPTRRRVRFTLRKLERSTFGHFTDARGSRQYVTDTGELVTGHDGPDAVERRDVKRFEVRDADGRLTEVRYGREAVKSAASDRIWHGNAIVIRPVSERTRKGRKSRSTSTVARKGRPKSAPSVTVPTPDASGVITVETRRGTLTIRPAGASGRHSVTLATPAGVERWQSRTPAAAIVRAQ